MKINKPVVPRRHRPWGLEILHEDPDLLVINKEPGLLTMSYRRDEKRTAERVLTDYVRKGNPRSSQQVFVVHRLDRDTSGVLLFARTEQAQRTLKAGWKQTEKLYLAAVHGQLAQKSGVFSSHLAEDDDQFVHAVDDPGAGRLAQTAYTVIKEWRGLSLVRINLLTGRKNQVRVHFADAGHAVVGDLKYGDSSTLKERLALHSKSIAFNHPHRGERVLFDTGIPELFARLGGGLSEEEWTAAGLRGPDLHLLAAPVPRTPHRAPERGRPVSAPPPPYSAASDAHRGGRPGRKARIPRRP